MPASTSAAASLPTPVRLCDAKVGNQRVSQAEVDLDQSVPGQDPVPARVTSPRPGFRIPTSGPRLFSALPESEAPNQSGRRSERTPPSSPRSNLKHQRRPWQLGREGRYDPEPQQDRIAGAGRAGTYAAHHRGAIGTHGDLAGATAGELLMQHP